MSNYCFHCGLPISENTHFEIHDHDQTHLACCIGCQSVAQSILDAGLGSYYVNRTANAEKATLPPDEILAQLKLYDLPEVQAEFVETLPENEKEATLMLSGMTCAACTWLIEQRLMRQNGIAKVELNYSTQRARIRWHDEQLHLSDILSLIQQTGYTAAPYDAQKLEQSALAERKKMLIRLAVAGLASMQTMMFALPTYLYHDIETQWLTVLHWGGFLMVLPALLYSAQPFYFGAWRDLKNRRTGMDTPVALAITLTFIAGLYALLTNAGQGMYFESIAMFVFFLLLGRFMEQSARRKAGNAAEKLVKLMPAFCHRLPNFPHRENSEETAVVSLKIGDVIAVRAGEIIPIDGVILRGESEVNESMLTGESLPILKCSGSYVVAGTLNTSDALIIQTTQVGNQTRLAHIVKLLDSALAQKPHLAQLAEQYASGFTLSLIVLAVPTFLAWWYLSDAAHALWITVSLLVITCPCALSLATPAALAASTGKLANDGILIAQGYALERLAQISDAVFDKTGTLTEGKLSVSAWQNLSGSLKNDELLSIARALEQHSEHPMAQAILAFTAHLPENLSVQNRQNHIGRGITGEVKSQKWTLGRADFVGHSENLETHSGSLILLGNENGVQAAFWLTDTLKTDTQIMLEKLKNQKIQLHILSGDSKTAVAELAKSVGIEHFRAECSPEDKLVYVQNLQRDNRRVLMLGDGINDAPVLAAADVSVAVSGSADVAREGADVVLLRDDFAALPTMLTQAHRTRTVIRQNLWWATGYNLAVVPLAVLGYVTPWIAAIGMSASSLLVVYNALRLRR